jgi:hypothetical protein
MLTGWEWAALFGVLWLLYTLNVVLDRFDRLVTTAERVASSSEEVASEIKALRREVDALRLAMNEPKNSKLFAKYGYPDLPV